MLLESDGEAMTDHGSIRSYRTETRPLGDPTPATTADGAAFTVPAATITESVSERFCAVHGWMPVRGVMGALVWHMDHDGCAP